MTNNTRTPIDMTQPKLCPGFVPVEGDTISVGGRSVRLGSKIGEGGEGAVYKLDDGTVCKIYKAEKLTEPLERKITLMTQHPVMVKGVCWPLATVFNSNGVFVGYTMPSASGLSLYEAVFSPERVQRNFPTWNRLDLTSLARRIVGRIAALHQRGVLIGDINFNNILISVSPHDPTKVDIFFVDTDSYQLGVFPSPVGTPEFLAPDLQGKNLRTLLRTPEQEHFAVSTLMFMILMLGQHPYARRDGSSPLENIRLGRYPYDRSRGVDRRYEVPFGPWQMIYSNFSGLLRATFAKAFVDHDYPTAEAWYKVLGAEYNALRNGTKCSDLVPDKFYVRPENAVTVKCDKCGKPFEINKHYLDHLISMGKPLICPECSEEIVVPCERCGCGNFVLIRRYKYNEIKAKGRQVLCPEHFAAGQNAAD